MSGTPVNVIRTSTGKLRPVCEFCGRVGRAATPTLGDGQLSVWDVTQGWAVDCTHPDGSTGDLWRCSTCVDRLDRGEALRPRREGEACDRPREFSPRGPDRRTT